jgi:periplasmic protein TonB
MTRHFAHPLLTACAVLLMAAATPPAAAQQAPKIVKKVPPEFPADALRKGVDRGVLKAKITVDGAGVPTDVEIVETQPAKARMLSNALIDSLKTWRWEGQGKPASFELQVVLSAE